MLLGAQTEQELTTSMRSGQAKIMGNLYKHCSEVQKQSLTGVIREAEVERRDHLKRNFSILNNREMG
jgi:hypothetical protein